MRLILLLMLAVVVVAIPAHADLTWTLDGVTFNDGGTATGTFTFLETTNPNGAFDWSITVAGGDTTDFGSSFTYNSGDSTATAIGDQFFLIGPAHRVFVLELAEQSPTSGPANVPLRIAAPFRTGECSDNLCTGQRFANAGSVDVSGSITVFQTPEPPTGWPLLGLTGLVLMLNARRARRLRRSS